MVKIVEDGGDVFDSPDDVLGLFQQFFALRSQVDAVGKPDEKQCPEFFLQLPDLFAERRLRDKKLFRRHGKASAFCDIEKIFQLNRIHVSLILFAEYTSS